MAIAAESLLVEHEAVANPLVQNGFNDAFVTEEQLTAQKQASIEDKGNGHINGQYQNDTNTGSVRAPAFLLQDTLIDEPRRLRVAVIGAGLAGITAGTLLPAKVPNIDLTIFEKNHDVSGKLASVEVSTGPTLLTLRRHLAREHLPWSPL